MKRLILVSSFVFTSMMAHGQVLISLVFGDKLNSGKVEFGLDGGATYSTMPGYEGGKVNPGFNLGFYFDIKTKTNWLLHTGVIVKSPMGTKGLAVYSLENPDLDNAFTGGSIERNLSYFNVPVMMKYPFRNHLYLEGGIQLGLYYNATDKFSQEINKPDDLNYTVSIREKFHRLDAGPVVGVGYRLMKGNGMNLGVRYYYGIVDVEIDDTGANVYNRALYLNVGIPIGAGKAKEKKDEQ
jgi:hypothetical protein